MTATTTTTTSDDDEEDDDVVVVVDGVSSYGHWNASNLADAGRESDFKLGSSSLIRTRRLDRVKRHRRKVNERGSRMEASDGSRGL